MKYLMILIIALSSCQTLRHTDADAYDNAEPGEPTVQVRHDEPNRAAIFLKTLGGSMRPALTCQTNLGITTCQ